MQSGISEVVFCSERAGQYRWMLIRRALITIMILCNCAAQAVTAEQSTATSRETASKDTAVEVGRQRFEHSCAICHGLDARGNGPFAELLNVKPPDLTLLSRAAGGDFPFTRVYQRIDGRDLPLAHGTRLMPIWGQRLKREGGDETYVRGRILEIMLYLESLQQL